LTSVSYLDLPITCSLPTVPVDRIGHAQVSLLYKHFKRPCLRSGENTSAIIKKTTSALLRSGVERRKAIAAHNRPSEAEKELKATQEMSHFADALESGSDDPGTSDWNCEMTWIVARKAIFIGRDEDWMSARYGG